VYSKHLPISFGRNFWLFVLIASF